ncbi:MAG: formylglycine-generating enzyme family protein [Candidatus Eisenbacteria bacterium]|uniref:Formylglycine-generating enzyme family protein n=1 Tax=Eiseniibacteriota bacterium TaxID=2212470 RepID=A0A948RQT8_UNCEI|nr:formylglycine-generating enzyme family protein [Candidatus Eisenbacteria bacterium]MBU2689285.1 formylglycine-generating enzyme family protein [Candidatus Eisenbacteria bacterium]
MGVPETVPIPAGPFLMGDDEVRDASPARSIYLDAFYIGRFEVTNAQYDIFLDANPDHDPPAYRHHEGYDDPSQPVVGVSWYDAKAYCAWLTRVTGHYYRLPTEAEWEKAARGPDGRTFPWTGGEVDLHRANFGQPHGRPKRVGEHPAGGNPEYEMMDVAGNVAEWCEDWFAEDYYEHGPPRNPLGSWQGTRKVVRGGSWQDKQEMVRCAFRSHYPPDTRRDTIGFRIAQSPD